MPRKSYSQLMGEHPVHIILRLDTKKPIELRDFVGSLTAVAFEYERFVKNTRPDLSGEARIYVSEIRQGSFIVELVPLLATMLPVLPESIQTKIVEEFVSLYFEKLKALISGDKEKQPNTKGELKNFLDTVEAVANDPEASAQIEVAHFEDGERKIKSAFKFTTPEAKQVRLQIEEKRRELDEIDNSIHQRKLMIFTRSDVNFAELGKRSGERVKIEELFDKPLAIMYQSEMAEEQIKHEIRDADDNVYKKGFVVDVNVKLRDSKPVAYAITKLHEVIELPDEDE